MVVSLVFLALAFRKVEWPDVLHAWSGAQPAWMVAGLLLLVLAWWVAAIRWKVILHPAPHVRVVDTFSFITIGYLANTILPLRLGDLARATLMGRRRRIGISRSLGSMALERLMDIITLLFFILLLSLLMEIPSLVKAGLATMAGGGVGHAGWLGHALLSSRAAFLCAKGAGMGFARPACTACSDTY